MSLGQWRVAAIIESRNRQQKDERPDDSVANDFDRWYVAEQTPINREQSPARERGDRTEQALLIRHVGPIRHRGIRRIDGSQNRDSGKENRLLMGRQRR